MGSLQTQIPVSDSLDIWAGKEVSDPAPASVARSFYRPELDVLRFCCFLLVFVHHAGAERAQGNAFIRAVLGLGSLGVPVFFLLSSFLITELLLRERRKTSTVHVRAFYLRRILRIWPLYFAFLALCTGLGLLHLHAIQPIPSRMALFYLLLSGNWYLVLYGIPANALIVLWSVSVEEQFYLVWPWLARAGGATAIRLLAIVLFPASYLCLAVLAHRGTSDSALWTNTFVQMQFFATGSLLALWLADWKPMLSLLARAVLLVGTGFAWLVACSWCRLKQPDPHLSVVHACLGYALVNIGAVCLFVAFYNLSLPSGWFTRWLIYLGKISFGLYTFHYLALEMVSPIVHHVLPGLRRIPLTAPVSFFLTVACAACSYRFLETPALRLKERFAFVHSRPV